MALALLLVWAGRRALQAPPEEAVRSPLPGPVVLLAPVAGEEPRLECFLAALWALEPAPDLIVVVIEEFRPADPAATRLRELAGDLPPHVKLVPASPATHQSQKAKNLLTGMRAAGEAGVWVTVDSDTEPHPGWLGALLERLAEPGVTVATGYRWLIPAGIGSAFLAAWNGAALQVLRDPAHAFAWGGATAIRAADFEALEIGARLERALSTDMAVTQAVRAGGGRIQFAPGAVVPTYERPGFQEAVRWIVRQLVMFYRSTGGRGSWVLVYHVALVVLQLAALSVLVGVLPSPWGFGRWVTAVVLAAPTLRGMARAWRRFREMAAFPIAQVPGWDHARLAQVALSPAVAWVIVAGMVGARWVKSVDWRGVRYRIGRGNTVDQVEHLWT